MINKHYFLQLSLIVMIMVTSCLYLMSLATPSEETVKIRNALIHKVGQIEDFTWGPNAFPASFRVESASPPPYIKQFIKELSIDPKSSDLDKILITANKVLERGRYGGPIQSNTVDTLKTMLSDGTGYCSDYTQVFNGLAYTLGIPVREWGMSFDGYSGWGHAFNEIFDKNLGKWVFIDVFNSFYVTNNQGNPLSVLEFRELLNTAPDKFTIQKINPDRFGFKDETVAIDYYQRGMPLLFLIWANDVFSYDENPLIAFTGQFSRALEQLTGILLGIHQEIRLYPDHYNTTQRSDLLSLKHNVISIIALNLALGICFVLLLIKIINTRKTRYEQAT